MRMVLLEEINDKEHDPGYKFDRKVFDGESDETGNTKNTYGQRRGRGMDQGTHESV